jgi:hypothetical protein
VGGTDCAAPSEKTQTTQVNQTSGQRVKRWVAPISKGGWHRSQMVGGTDLKWWVAPISNGGWHRSQMVGGTDCDCALIRKIRILKMLSVNPKGDSSGVAMVTWVTPRRERSRQRGAKRATTTESDNQQATESKSPTSGGWHSVPISVVTATTTHLSTASAVDSSLNRKRRELRESTEIHFQLHLK